MNNSIKIPEIDILRAIAALAVITIHTSGYFSWIKHFIPLQIAAAYIDLFSGFAVPCFVFIGGLVLFNKYGTRIEKLPAFYKRRFFKILPIYLLFSIFYTFAPFLLNERSGDPFNIDYSLFVYNLFTGGANYHLWYFGILFQFYLLFPFIKMIYFKWAKLLLIISFNVQYGWMFFGADLVKSAQLALGFQVQKLPVFPGYLFWFVLGFFFVDHHKTILAKVRIGYGIVSILLLNLARVFPYYIALQHYTYKQIPLVYSNIALSLSPFLFILEILVFYKLSLKWINKRGLLPRLMQKTGVLSLEIYLIHAFVISLLLLLLKRFSITYNDVVFYPLIWLGTLLMSWIFAFCYQLIKRHLHDIFSKPLQLQ